jgi:cobalt-zinc-cadmium efflux system membrane fusion protein
VTRPTFIPTWAAAGMAAILLALFSLSAPVIAHEGHDHGAIAKPAVARLAPRFEVRSEDVEIVGVLADKVLLIYVDRASDNGPIQGAQIEVEGPGTKGIATAMADGVYQLPAAALAQAGKHPLTLSIQVGEIVDLLSATLEVGEVPAAASAKETTERPWWLFAGISLALLSGGLVARRLHRQAQERAIHHG